MDLLAFLQQANLTCDSRLWLAPGDIVIEDQDNVWFFEPMTLDNLLQQKGVDFFGAQE